MGEHLLTILMSLFSAADTFLERDAEQAKRLVGNGVIRRAHQ